MCPDIGTNTWGRARTSRNGADERARRGERPARRARRARRDRRRRSPTTRGRCRRRARAGASPTRSGTSPTSTAPRRWRSPTPTRSRRRRTRCSHRPTAARRLTLGLVPDDVARRSCSPHGARTDASSPTPSPTLADDTRVVWYGPSMGAKSFVTARLMETWAHGQDIVDTVGADRQATDRLRHVAQIGFITRGWSYVNRGLVPPDVPVFVELTAPSGATWTWGPDDAAESRHGPGGGLLPRRHATATRRRHRARRRRRRRQGVAAVRPGVRRRRDRRTTTEGRVMTTTLDWYGCATFRLRTGGLTIFLDAYIDRADQRRRSATTPSAPTTSTSATGSSSVTPTSTTSTAPSGSWPTPPPR